MTQNKEKKHIIETYEIDNKKYTVITKCTDNAQNIDKLYDVICKYLISQIYTSQNRGVEL